MWGNLEKSGNKLLVEYLGATDDPGHSQEQAYCEYEVRFHLQVYCAMLLCEAWEMGKLGKWMRP